jgi:F0F1-type ATP synthase assembly protein I
MARVVVSVADEEPDGAPRKAESPPLRPPRPAGVATIATGGIEFAITILLGVFAGQWLDRRMGTAPWLVILGVVFGGTVGFYNLYRTLTTAQRRGSSRAGRDSQKRREGNGT